MICVSVEWFEQYSAGLICLLTRIIMSVGYKPYVKLVVRLYRGNTYAVLTETNTIMVGPEEGNRPILEIQ